MKYVYTPKGVCSMQMIFEIDEGIVKSMQIIGGCPGNTIGVSKLIEGRDINEIIDMLKGIPCGNKRTSCPDQIAIALQEYKEKYKV